MLSEQNPKKLNETNFNGNHNKCWNICVEEPEHGGITSKTCCMYKMLLIIYARAEFSLFKRILWGRHTQRQTHTKSPNAMAITLKLNASSWLVFACRSVNKHKLYVEARFFRDSIQPTHTHMVQSIAIKICLLDSFDRRHFKIVKKIFTVSKIKWFGCFVCCVAFVDIVLNCSLTENSEMIKCVSKLNICFIKKMHDTRKKKSSIPKMRLVNKSTWAVYVLCLSVDGWFVLSKAQQAHADELVI